MPKPVIDYKKCTSCGTCISVCPVSVFEKKGKKTVVAKPADCIGCRACEAQCPSQAIKVED
jgi:NAD-dependent dihydropyrimidine dehydrogenase PreA subunit